MKRVAMGSMQTSETPQTIGPRQANAALEWLQNELTLRSNQLAAILVEGADRDAIDPLARATGTELLVISAVTSVLNLLTEARYDRIYVFRSIESIIDSEVQQRVHLALRAQGELVVVARSEDFAFAPLPIGGDMHLLKRKLSPAYFDSMRLERRGGDFIAVSLRRCADAAHR